MPLLDTNRTKKQIEMKTPVPEGLGERVAGWGGGGGEQGAGYERQLLRDRVPYVHSPNSTYYCRFLTTANLKY